MSPITHLLGSWMVGAAASEDPRDVRLITLAGILPDLDGAGVVIDLARIWTGQTTDFYYYPLFHHSLLHGAFGALLLASVLAALARHRLRVFGWAMLLVHLHLLCDLLGSRGPDPGDFWPIYYGAPFTLKSFWIWQGQWRLDGWQNRLLTAVLLAACLAWAIRRGDSFVGVFSRRLDAVFVRGLRSIKSRLDRRGSPKA